MGSGGRGVSSSTPAGASSETAAFQVDLHGMVDLLARHLYSSPRVYLRELLQNGVDALTARTALPAAFKEDMRRFHLALPKAHPAIYRDIERGGGTGYREVRHQDFEMIVELRREEAAARRRRS